MLYLKMIEILILACLTVVNAFLIQKRKSLGQQKRIIYIIISITLLIEIYGIIHFCFCYQIGLPASLTQNDATDLTLTSSDWLAFLGSFLGFAGSLVMACLVYLQSEAINKLTISEYQTAASLIINKCAKSSDFHPFNGRLLTQAIANNSHDYYYTLHCVFQSDKNYDCEAFEVLIFAEIVNNSKFSFKNLSFKQIKIVDTEDQNKVYMFPISSDPKDYTDGITEIHPGQKLKRCFMLENMPKNINISWMTIQFTYGKGDSLDLPALIQKAAGESITFHSLSQ